MKNKIKEKDIIQNSLECLSNVKFNDTTYLVARDIVLDYIINLQYEIKKLNKELKNIKNRNKNAIKYIKHNYTNRDGSIWHFGFLDIYNLLKGKK